MSGPQPARAVPTDRDLPFALVHYGLAAGAETIRDSKAENCMM
jgi:hypothetical protein